MKTIPATRYKAGGVVFLIISLLPLAAAIILVRTPKPSLSAVFFAMTALYLAVGVFCLRKSKQP